METFVFDPTPWAALPGRLPELAPLAGLALVFGLGLGWLLDRLLSIATRPRPRRVVEPRPAPAPKPEHLPAPVERMLAAVGTRATVPEDSPLYGVGMSQADVIALTSLREHVREGDVAEDPKLANRVAFARWLAEHNRLSD